MMKTVLATFNNRRDVEDTIDKLQTQGFNPKDISLVMKDSKQSKDISHDTGATMAGDTVKGVTTGAVVGGIAGLLAGIALPGLGAFLIGGPIAAALGLGGAAASTVSGVATGAVAGGLLGALMGLGLSESDAKKYESRVKEGAILLAVPANEDDVPYVTGVFDDYNAADVTTVDQPTEGIRQKSTAHYFADRAEEDRENEGEVSQPHTHHYATAGMKGGKTGHHDSKHHSKSEKGVKGGAAMHSHTSSDSYVNPIQVQKYLKGVDYPCSKDELLDAAKGEGANEDVMHTLDAMPGKKFNSPNDVSQAIGKIE